MFFASLLAVVLVGLLLFLLVLLCVGFAILHFRTRRSTCLHEAAHAVTAWCSPIARPVRTEAGSFSGVCTVAYDLPHDRDSDYYMWVAVIFMAGAAAEALAGRSTWIFSYESDISMAAIHAGESLRNASPELLAALNEVSPEDEMAVTNLLTKNDFSAPADDHLKALALSYSLAKDIVSRHWDKTGDLAGMLYLRGQLHEQELNNILGHPPDVTPLYR